MPSRSDQKPRLLSRGFSLVMISQNLIDSTPGAVSPLSPLACLYSAASHLRSLCLHRGQWSRQYLWFRKNHSPHNHHLPCSPAEMHQGACGWASSSLSLNLPYLIGCVQRVDVRRVSKGVLLSPSRINDSLCRRQIDHGSKGKTSGANLFLRTADSTQSKCLYCMRNLRVLSSRPDINFGWIFPQRAQA